MNKIVLIKNAELFQGEKYLNKKKNYFEGWYFKNTNAQKGISFIPGINIEEMGAKAFIQVITNQKSYFVNYDIKDFKINNHPFSIRIGDNIFSKEAININIEDKTQDLKIYGNIKYSNSQNINTSMLAPNIMGPFSYLPFMECNHAIISMNNTTNGHIKIKNDTIQFNNDNGYIEKDWGCSFPKSYVWCQGNHFQKSKASFMFSIAEIPFKIFNFQGFICVLQINNEEFRFTTYNNAKIAECDIKENSFNITFKRGLYSLNIKSNYNKGLKLAAPIKGKMERNIFESICASATITLKKEKKIIFSDTSNRCGLEVVKKHETSN
jgi:tocopherol cyclase